jgi:hypothetical protein
MICRHPAKSRSPTDRTHGHPLAMPTYDFSDDGFVRREETLASVTSPIYSASRSSTSERA